MNVRDLAAAVLRDAARSRRFVDEALEAPRASVPDRRDRALLTALVHGVARHRLTLDRLLEAASGRPADPELADVLRVGAFQLLFLTRVPPSAAVHEAVESARRLKPAAAGFVNAVLRNLQRGLGGDVPLPRPGLEPLGLKRAPWGDDPVERLSVAHSHPDWLVRRWLGHGWSPERVEAICAAGNLPPVVQVWSNSGESAAALLGAAGVAVEERPGGLVALAGAGDLAALEPFRDGRLRVQDEAAARVAPLLDPRPGELVLDACAAPGGKTAHLAALGARVVALDRSLDKAALVAASTRGLPAGRVRLLVADARRPPLRGSFDAVLLDVPCSNTGVLGRRPDARWRIAPSDLARLRPLQDAILDAAAPLVRPGGRLVYSTCSLEPDENEQAVAAFLARHPEFRPGAELRVDPAGGSGGGYARRLDRPA